MTNQPNQDAMGELRDGIEDILCAIEPGETRVSYPDGRSEIVSSFSLAIDDIVRIAEAFAQRREEEALVEGARRYNIAFTSELGKPTYMDDEDGRHTVYKHEWVSDAVQKANQETIQQGTPTEDKT